MDMPASAGLVDPATPEAEPGEVLARADALRDRQDWPEAAQAYAAFLRLRPTQWPIWVQYGHCMKECGDPKSALLLYREAERLEPADADVQLQIGHALKLLGRQEDASQAYARALTLDPGNAFARAELLALEPAAPEEEHGAVPSLVDRPAATPAMAPATVFEATDLLDWFRHNRAPTGIQRVQLDIVQAAVRADPDGIGIVAFDPAGGAWKAIPAPLFERLADLSRSGAGTADAAWQDATADAAAVLAEAPPAAFPQGGTLIQLGTSWWIPDYLRQVRAAKARFGLRYVPMLHDCIPLVVPEHCAHGLVDEFARWFAGACLHADAVLCISECTRADFRRLQRALLPDVEIPAFVVPLQAAPWLPPGDQAPSPQRARPYVLFVGTIESRKNHLLAFHAWLTLLRRHGPAAVPDLVCVGKLGWMAEAALSLHANSPELRARVHLLHGVADGHLAALYRGCLFTLYNSFYEGWGLPVTESLACGKVPLVPDHSSLREAGGEGARYFTPQSGPDLVAQLERLIFDAAFRQEQEATLRRTTRLRSWDDLTADLLRHAAEAGPALPPPLARLGLRMGEIHAIRLIPGPTATRRMAAADALREGPGWWPLEDWGVWTAPGGSALRLPVEAGRLRVHLELLAPPQACRFSLSAGSSRSIEAAANERLFCVLETQADAAGDLLVEIETETPVALPRTGRTVGIGLCSVMVCRRDDLVARLDYLEGKALRTK